MSADPIDFSFVVGTGRCGSTLVHETLARCPGVGFVSNLDDRISRGLGGRWNNALYSRLPSSATKKGRIRFAPSEGYRILDRRVSPAISTPFRDLTAADATPWLADRFAGFFREEAAAQRCDVFIHKFTGWPRAGFVAKALPGSRFVHIVRDGRAVANSWLQMPWWLGYRGPNAWQFGSLPPAYLDEWERSDRSFVVLAGIAWKLLLDAYQVARSSVPAVDWLELRYEDIVADPRASFARMLEHVGAEWSREFEEHLARVQFSAGRAEAYRHELDKESVAVLDASLASHLARLGYPSPG